MIVFWTAFTIGLLGSLHCVGMCGPIAFALPVRSDKWSRKAIASLIYNSGRILTYALFGLLFGLIGKGFRTAGLQQTLSIVIGVLFILAVILPPALTRIPDKGISRMSIRLKQRFGKLLRSQSRHALFSIGLLNGLLPCGLVYLAIGGAITTGSALEGSLFMLFFGLGTLPLMFTVVVAANQVSLQLRQKVRKAVPVFIFLMGILFILRGSNLDIPYLSPRINVERAFVESCH